MVLGADIIAGGAWTGAFGWEHVLVQDFLR